MEAVPAVSIGIPDTLLEPVFVQGEHLPGTVVKIGLLPGGVVPFAETGAFNNNGLGAGRLQKTEGQHKEKSGNKYLHNCRVKFTPYKIGKIRHRISFVFAKKTLRNDNRLSSGKWPTRE